jgi:hypothetical protein
MARRRSTLNRPRAPCAMILGRSYETIVLLLKSNSEWLNGSTVPDARRQIKAPCGGASSSSFKIFQYNHCSVSQPRNVLDRTLAMEMNHLNATRTKGSPHLDRHTCCPSLQTQPMGRQPLPYFRDDSFNIIVGRIPANLNHTLPRETKQPQRNPILVSDRHIVGFISGKEREERENELGGDRRTAKPSAIHFAHADDERAELAE